MKEYLKKNGIRLAVILLVVVLVAAVSSQVLSGGAGFLTNIIVAVREPVNKAATAAGDLLDGIYGYIFDYEELQAKVEALEIQLAEAQEQVREGQSAVEENRRYEQLLGFAEENSDYVMEQARVVSWNASNYANSFTISKGSSDGLAVGDAVITEYGTLIGQISQLGTNWAEVRTVIDVDTSIGVLVGTNAAAAMLVGDFALMRDGEAKVTWLTEGAQLFRDDEILTSGSGNLIPSGLVVGTVSSIQSEAAGQTEYGIITPAVDFGTLSQVFIITDFEGSGATDDQNTLQPETTTAPSAEPSAAPSVSPSTAPATPVTGG